MVIPALRMVTLCVALVIGIGSHVATTSASTASIPKITRPVTDLTLPEHRGAGSLTPADTEAIGRQLVDHHAATGVQLAIMIVDTTYGQPIEDFAQRVFETWGGGSAGRNDGALFVLAIADRRNRLHLGYGLEPVIPDASAKRMLDALRPSLRTGNYAAATRELVAGFRARTAHLKRGGARRLPLGATSWVWGAIVILAVCIGVAWSFVFRRGRSAWRRRPMRGNHKKFPAWYVRAATAVVDFFKYRPAAIALGGMLAVQLLLLILFRQGESYASVYSLVYWMFIPVGWVLGVKRKRVSIPWAFLVIAYIMVAFDTGATETLADAATLKETVLPSLGLFICAMFGMLLCVIGPLNMEGGGGSSYSSSSSRSSYSSSSSRSYTSSSSRSSSSSSYSGGGGRSGGGGASSSW